MEEKEQKSKKISITEIRETNSNKILDLLENLKLETNEARKTVSRAYSKLASLTTKKPKKIK